LIEPDNKEISISKQCELLEISRTQYYYKAKSESQENLDIMREMDKQYLKTPYYGVERLTAHIRKKMGIRVNQKRIRRLMRLMGLEAIYRRPNLSKKDSSHEVYPYLLRGVEINRVNQVWSIDITYVPMKSGYMYLVAVIDWHSRYVLSWNLSNSLDGRYSREALLESLKYGKPEIFNSDQGSQFTATEFTEILEKAEIRISMDGKGRALDNIFIERFWKSIKYECIYLSQFNDGNELYKTIKSYIDFYNNERPHQSLCYKTPAEVYFENQKNAC